MQLLMYQYRLYPSSVHKERVVEQLISCKVLYNELLALCNDAYKFGKVSLNKFDLNTYVRGKHSEVHSQVCQNVSDRVHKAFQNFFRRLKDKSCKNKGFPRFKSRVNSITFPQSGFKFVSNKRLFVSNIGNIPIVLHRVPRGKIKTMTIKQNKAGQWFVSFACETETSSIKHQSTEKVGIDLGLENFATLSNGEVVSNPRHIVKAEKRLKVLHRKLSKKKKGSNNRKKARQVLSKQYIKLVNQRTDFLHNLSHKISLEYSFISVEDLNIKNMVTNHWLAKSITDASWNNFVQMLSYKAVKCGGQVVKVNPRMTSKKCSQCGSIVQMPLSQRQFSCPSCGFVCHRDLNASVNILKVGQDLPELNACEHNARPLLKAVVDEAGTTNGK